LIVAAVLLTCIIGGLIFNIAFDTRFGPAAAIGEHLDPAFTLIDQNNHPFTNAAFIGKPRVILFGYTGCADICPTMLSALAGNISELGISAANVTFVFMTVDPEHDTPSRLKTYLEQFSTKLVGLTGKPKDVFNILGAYGVYRKRHADGVIDHSAVALLIDAHGILRDRIKENQLGSSATLSKLQRLIGSPGQGVTKENEGSS
jgi:protein SCO1/2